MRLRNVAAEVSAIDRPDCRSSQTFFAPARLHRQRSPPSGANERHTGHTRTHSDSPSARLVLKGRRRAHGQVQAEAGL